MAKSSAITQRPIFGPSNKEQEPIVQVYNFLEGLITDNDPSQIPINALTLAQNATFIRKMLFRRNGVNPWTISKPNSLQIQGVFPFFEKVTGLNILRFTKSTIHKSTSTGWINYPASGIAANSGSNNEYFSFTVIDNRGFYSNEGIDPIREVDPVLQVYKALGNAPRYKYITSAFNRIIGVNLRDAIGGDVPYQVGWCGESNYDEWDPTVDISAGAQNLTSSPTTITDDCTGVFSTGNLLIVTRQQSIWLGTHTPSSTSPFSFFAQLPHIGADLPRTIFLTDYGLAWVSNQTSSVYVWVPGTVVNDPAQIMISEKISRQLRMVLNNADQAWASYNQEAKTYSVFISNTSSSLVDVFEYSFLLKAWSTSTINPSVTCTTNVNYSNSTITIDDLTGTISALLGTIDSLGGLRQNSTVIYGYNSGNLATQELFSGLTPELNTASLVDLLEDNFYLFETSIATKIFEAPPKDFMAEIVRFKVIPYSAGFLYIYESVDGEVPLPIKSAAMLGTGIPEFIQIKRARKFTTIQYFIKTVDCMFALTGFLILGQPAGVSK